MISSRTLRFELFQRRALYLSAHKATVYHWKKGDLGTSFLFDANDEGRRYFSRYLKETPNTPMYMLVDVFEEEFRRETMPHVYGGDRAAIIARRKARLFRDTPYFNYTVQGREADGRRDDRVLLSAITSPKAVRPWSALLEDEKVPLAGIYSLPMLATSLLKLLPGGKDNVLIVSLHSVSGLRQTFIRDGELRVSRLIQMPRYGTEPYGPHIREEVEKIRRYLNSLRLATPEEPIEIYFLMAGELLDEMKHQYRDSGASRHHVIDINELLKSAGSGRRVSVPFSDQLFVHQLLQKPPSNVYASGSDRRYFTLRRMRHAMLAASAVLLLGSAAWGGFNLMGGLSYKQQSLLAQSKTDFYNTRYEMARERLPQTPVEPADLQVAVEIADVLKGYKTTPFGMMRLLSTGLQNQPMVQIDSIDWRASSNPNASADDRAGAAPPVAALPPPGPERPAYRFYQIAVINGRIEPFDGNYREAITTIQRFAESFRRMESVYDVQVLSLPLDISSSASLQGSTQARQKEAGFSVRLVMGIGREA